MRLRTLAGAYAGQVRDYDPVAGLAALRSGTAEALDRVSRVAVQAVPVKAAGLGSKKAKRSETTAA